MLYQKDMHTCPILFGSKFDISAHLDTHLYKVIWYIKPMLYVLGNWQRWNYCCRSRRC